MRRYAGIHMLIHTAMLSWALAVSPTPGPPRLIARLGTIKQLRIPVSTGGVLPTQTYIIVYCSVWGDISPERTTDLFV